MLKTINHYLKSNMDRFIAQLPAQKTYGKTNLKSNMDRFIDAEITF